MSEYARLAARSGGRRQFESGLVVHSRMDASVLFRWGRSALGVPEGVSSPSGRSGSAPRDRENTDSSEHEHERRHNEALVG